MNLFILRIDKQNKFKWFNTSIEEIVNQVRIKNQNLFVKFHSENLIEKCGNIYEHKFIDMQNFSFSKNYFMNICEKNNKLDMILSFYYNDKQSKNSYLIIYTLSIFNRNGICFSTNVKEILLNFNLFSIEAFFCKISEFGRVICYALSYEDKYFEIILYYRDLQVFKSKTNIFLN